MGDEIIIKRIEIVNNGSLQIDFYNVDTNQQWRAFAQPASFFGMLGQAMQKQRDKYMTEFFERQKAAKDANNDK